MQAYHHLLVWDIMKKPLATRLAERVLNPLIGKSLVRLPAQAGGRVSAEIPSPARGC